MVFWRYTQPYTQWTISFDALIRKLQILPDLDLAKIQVWYNLVVIWLVHQKIKPIEWGVQCTRFTTIFVCTNYKMTLRKDQNHLKSSRNCNYCCCNGRGGQNPIIKGCIISSHSIHHISTSKYIANWVYQIHYQKNPLFKMSECS